MEESQRCEQMHFSVSFFNKREEKPSWELSPKSLACYRNSVLCKVSVEPDNSLEKMKLYSKSLLEEGKEGKKGRKGREEKFRMTPAYESCDIQKCAHLKHSCQRFPQPIASKATSEFAGLRVETWNGK